MVFKAFIYSNKYTLTCTFAYISLGKIIATYLLHCNMWHCTSSLLGIGFHCPHSRSSRKTCMCDGQDCSNNGDSDRNIPLAFLEDSKLFFLLKTVKKKIYISKIVSTTGWQHYLKACIVSWALFGQDWINKWMNQSIIIIYISYIYDVITVPRKEFISSVWTVSHALPLCYETVCISTIPRVSERITVVFFCIVVHINRNLSLRSRPSICR